MAGYFITNIRNFINHHQQLPLDRRLTYQVLLILSVVAFVSGFINMLIPYPAWFPFVFFGVSMLSFTAVWLNYKRPKSNIARIIFVIAIYPISILTWIYNSGIYGSSVLFFYTVIVYFAGIFNQRFIFFFIINMLIFSGLSILTYYYPQMILYNYQTANDQVVDLICTYFLLGISMVLILKSIIRSYEQEKNIAEEQKRQVQLLNNILQIKNDELKTANQELNLANKKIEESEENLSSLVNNREESIWSIDKDYNFLLVNDIFRIGFFEVFEVELKKGMNALSMLPADIADFWRSKYDQAIKGRKLVFEFSLMIRNELQYFEVFLNPIYKDGQVSGLSCISVNITNRKKSDQALKTSEQKLQELNADKDRFMSILAHDLKTPFNTLLGFSNLLMKNIDKYDHEKIKNQVRYINDAAYKTFNLMDDLLMWSKSQSGKIPFEPESVILSEIVAEVMITLKMQSGKKNITVNYSEKENIILFADIQMIKAVLRNLVANAIKFTFNGGNIKINAKHNSDSVVVSVTDNGIGMEPEIMEKLWNPAQPFTTFGTENESGTGLGLLLCKEFVEKHRGRIWVESEHGIGSTFFFTLPEYISPN